MPEKYWGPSGELMTEEEIHDFGIQVVVKDLQKEGHEIVSVETDLGREPQIVAKIQGRQAFISVRTAMYPGNGQLTDLALVDRLISHAKTHHATPYFGSVGIANSKGVDAGDEDQSSKPVRGAGFYVNYRGLQILASADRVKVLDQGGRLTELVPKDLNAQVFSKAVANIAEDLGSLDDLPAELANTAANVYYTFWMRLIALAPLREGAPAPAGTENHPDGILGGYMHYIKTNPSIIAGYKFAADMIKAIRGIAEKHPDRKELVDYMVQVALDSLKYNIDNAHQKTPIRRAIERKFKKPDEIPGLYGKMRPLLTASLRREGDG